jgi:Tfp pilus assembly protein PilE
MGHSSPPRKPKNQTPVNLGLALNCQMAAVSKSNMARKTSKLSGFNVLEICIVVVLIVLLALIARPNFVHGGPRHRDSCINNLRITDGAKRRWAFENHKQNTDTPAGSDLLPYLGRGPGGEGPVCPNDSRQTFESSYSINNVGTAPTCKINPATHVLMGP